MASEEVSGAIFFCLVGEESLATGRKKQLADMAISRFFRNFAQANEHAPYHTNGRQGLTMKKNN